MTGSQERVYLMQPFLETLETTGTVVSDEEGLFVCLEETILFPGGGGQPPSHGTLSTGGVTCSVTAHKITDEDVIIHKVDAAFAAALEASGDARVEVRLALGRRVDHTQQHSAQHLISAVAYEMFGSETVSWDLREDVTTVDLTTTPDFCRAAVPDLQAAVNARIASGLSVVSHSVAADVVAGGEDLGLSCPLRSRGVPEGATAVRLVEIDGVDVNTCCGTHVTSTAGLQMVVMTRVQEMRKGKVLRITFLAGDRVAAFVDRACAMERALGKALGGRDPVDAVTALQAELKAANKVQSALLAELAEAMASGLIAEADTSAGMPVVVYKRGDAGKGFVNALVKQVLEEAPDALVAVVGMGVFVVGSPSAPDLVASAGPAVAALLGGRGGGRNGKFQGKTGDASEGVTVEDLRALLLPPVE